MKLCAQSRRSRDDGIASTETLLAVPLVLLLGLSVLQWALVFNGRQAVAHATIEAGRSGSVDHASSEAIERGLSRGLAPWLYGASGPVDHAVNLGRAQAHLRTGIAAGWAAWRRIAPTAQSFADWGETALDDRGVPLSGLLEIPNDGLTLRAGSRLPVGGVSGYRSGEPIGAASGQTLTDANLLKIDVVYGVPLTVPLVGRIAAWIMRGVDGCGGGSGVRASVEATGSASWDGGRIRLGTLDLGNPAIVGASRAWACAYYDAVDERGRAKPRWPVRVSATVRMQSPARSAAEAPQLLSPPQAGESFGQGVVDDADDFRLLPVRQVNPAGAGPTGDGSVDRSPGFLRIGGDRLTEPPGFCSATSA